MNKKDACNKKPLSRHPSLPYTISATYDILNNIYHKDNKSIEQEVNDFSLYLKNHGEAPKISRSLLLNRLRDKNSSTVNTESSIIQYKTPSTLKKRRRFLRNQVLSKNYSFAFQTRSPPQHKKTRATQQTHRSSITAEVQPNRSFISNPRLDRKFTRLKNILSEGYLSVRKSLPQLEKNVKATIAIEEYKSARNKVTRDLLQGIYVSNPQIIPKEYSNKLDSEIESEREAAAVVRKYKIMMENPRREVARFERVRRPQHKRGELVNFLKKSFRRYTIMN